MSFSEPLFTPLKVNSKQNHLVHYSGAPLVSSTGYRWNVVVKATSGSSITSVNSTFITGLLSPNEWSIANWITGGNLANQLRKEFSLPSNQGPITSAVVHISALGYFELRCNGKKVGDRNLDVGWTDYAKRAYYVTFDLAPYLNPGSRNAFAVSLGNSWFSCLGQQPGCYNLPPQVIVRATVFYASGSPFQFTSDLTWKVSSGPIIYNSLYNGETYDARLETSGWYASKGTKGK